MKKKKHLPLMGVGPIYVMVIIVCTIAGIAFVETERLQSGQMAITKIPFMILGIALIVLGLCLWMSANIQAKIDSNIKSNTLVTKGVYSHVRNPIYSAFMMMCTGALFIANNLWLYDLYGESYLEYCKRVNRCIPWF